MQFKVMYNFIFPIHLYLSLNDAFSKISHIEASIFYCNNSSQEGESSINAKKLVTLKKEQKWEASWEI